MDEEWRDEEWRDIEEFEGIYQVSNYGRVRSVERYINTRTYPAQIIKPFVGNNGCVMVRLRQKNKITKMYITSVYRQK